MKTGKWTKKYDLTHLKEHCNIDDEDEVQEITAARNPMKKNNAVYVTCNQTFAMQNRWKKHLQEEQTELWWNYCGKVFRNRKEVNNHMYEELKKKTVMNGPQKMRLKITKKTLLLRRKV